MNMKTKKHIGSNLDDFLREEGILQEVEEAVAKRLREKPTSRNRLHNHRVGGSLLTKRRPRCHNDDIPHSDQAASER